MVHTSFDGCRVWRVAAGGEGRDLTEYFMRFGLALVGPGYGDWREVGAEPYGSEAHFIRPISESEPGDIMLMMLGHRIVAVGLIDGAYRYWDDSGHREGWDLKHTRRVRWARVDRLDGFSGFPRYQVRGRASAVGDSDVVQRAREAADIAERLRLFSGPLPDLPEDETRLDWAAPSCCQKAIDRAKQLRRAIQEDRGWEWPSEAEALALLVVPFLLDCGVEPVNIALEWHRIDLAVFTGPARSDSDCRLVVEAKHPGRGLAHARDQGNAYQVALKVNVPLVTTDGFVWSLFRNADDNQPREAFLPDPTTSAQFFFEDLMSILGTPDEL
jgi:hypothetical protein